MASQRHQSRKKPASRPKGAPRGGSDRQSSRGRPFPPEVREEILCQVASGRKALEVAEEFGVHNTTISHWKKEEATKRNEGPPPPAPKAAAAASPPPPRETGRYSQAFKEEVLAQVRSGRKLVEVARQYHLPEKTISRWLEETRASGGELPDPKTTRPPTNLFYWAGSYSLSRELTSRENINHIQIGDVFIHGGFPGHAVIVVDMAQNKQTGDMVFMIAQSYMPAQEVHILKNPDNAFLSPWYQIPAGNQLDTPEWTFQVKELKYFE